MNREMRTAQAACKARRELLSIAAHIWLLFVVDAPCPGNNQTHIYVYTHIYVEMYVCLVYVYVHAHLEDWLQESRNSLAPVTVKLGNYSEWNRSRDFSRTVRQPLDRAGPK